MIKKLEMTIDFEKAKPKIKKLIKKLAIQSVSDNPGKLLKKRIEEGVNYNNDKLTPLKKSTLNIRKMKGRSGTKPLIDTGKLLNSIKTVKQKIKLE